MRNLFKVSISVLLFATFSSVADAVELVPFHYSPLELSGFDRCGAPYVLGEFEDTPGNSLIASGFQWIRSWVQLPPKTLPITQTGNYAIWFRYSTGYNSNRVVSLKDPDGIEFFKATINFPDVVCNYLTP